MGTLANSLFQALLGWIRTLSSQIWATASAPETGTLLSWIGQHWIGLAIILCAAGVCIDLIVYLIRWQPWRVWRSFFHRIGDREERAARRAERRAARDEETEEAYETEYEDEYTEDYTESPETRYAPEPAYMMEEEEPYPPEEEESLTWSRREPEGTTAAFAQAILPERRRRVRRLFAEPGEEETPAPEELIDRYAAYRRPVYPRSWKAAEGEEET